MIILQLQDALVYLDLVKTTFESTPEVNDYIRKIIKYFRLKRFSDIQTTKSIYFELIFLGFEIV